MNSDTVRTPIQQRAIDKKNRIIKVGIHLLCTNGYQKTTMTMIAKEAHVSVGIIYSYFKDKKEILLQGLHMMSEEALEPLNKSFEKNPNLSDLFQSLGDLLDYLVEFHLKYMHAHQELYSMALFDKDICDFITSLREKIYDNLINICNAHGIVINNLYERLHIVYDLTENYAHQVAFYPDEHMNLSIYKNMTLESIKQLLLI